MAVLDSINAAIQWLEQARSELQQAQPPVAAPTTQLQSPATDTSTSSDLQRIAWGSKVSPAFKARVIWMADQLGCNPSDLMACMAWESGETFSPSVKNMAGSGAIGLIQFMPATAIKLGTTVGDLAAMSAENQLRHVYAYFQPYAGRLKNLGDVYMAILWPAGVGKVDSFVLFDRSKTPTTFRQNAGLDVNHDGLVTRGECLSKIQAKLAKGMQPGYIG